MHFLKKYIALWLPLIFFIIGLFTIYDYGMNWDSPIHFARGQAYLRYILTGKTNYEGLHKFCTNKYNLNSSVDFETGEICDRHRKTKISEYESNLLDFNSWVGKAVYGHPAFSNLMLAASNNIFFKYLGLVEDVPAYHLYSLFATFILALTISIWTKQAFGTFASIIAVLTIYTFPLLFGEQHFNVKDPPMAAFFTLSIYLFWLGVTKKKPLYLILSALAGGASFGTKFNFVFAPFILLPWILIYGKKILDKKALHSFSSREMMIAVFLYPVIVFLVFFLTWPALWTDPLNNVPQVFKYYQDIGGPTCNYPYLSFSWWKECSDLTTLKYFIYTIPPISLFFFIVGFFVSLVWIKRKDYLPLLILSFFLVTILRVTLSIASIYGGLRQILEFIGPFAFISGVGAYFIREFIVKNLKRANFLSKLKSKTLYFIVSLVLILCFTPIILTLIKLHPNENIYFNFLIGGFKGASEKNFPGYGNTYGNAYLQGIKWLNQNMETDSKLSLASGLGQNLSRGSLRGDIDYANNYRSGYNMDGEYQMLLIEGNDPLVETFRYKYLLFLDPLYELNIDGIPLLKIWKNDKTLLKKGINFESQQEKNLSTEIDKNEVVLILEDIKSLKGLGTTAPNQECKNAMIGTEISISADGENYLQKAEGINNFTESEIFGYKADYVYFFPADKAKYIKIIFPPEYPCKLSEIKFTVYTFVNENF